MEKGKKIISLGLASMLSLGMLTGCGQSSTQAEVAKEPEVMSSVVNAFDSFSTNPGIKEFSPYEHVFFIRYDTLELSSNSYSENVSGGSITIPEGYEILFMQNFEERNGYRSQTRGG